MNGIDMMVITCPSHVAKSLADELEDKLAEQHSPARILKYGVMSKGQHGFIIFACPYPDGFPSTFFDFIQKDEEITGYVLVNGDNSTGAGEEAQA